MSSLIASTGSAVRELIACVAPNSRAHSSFLSSTSTAMIVLAPGQPGAERRPPSPTPPQPITATVSPRVTPPVLIAAPMPGHHAAAEQARGGGRDRRVDLRALAGRDQRPLGERADAERGRQRRCRRRGVIFCVALWVLKQYQGRPRLQARHCPQTARQLRITKSPGATSVTPSPTASTMPGRLVPEQVGEVVADPAHLVVQVGVADAAGLHPHQRLARARVRHQYLGHHRTGSPLPRDTTP